MVRSIGSIVKAGIVKLGFIGQGYVGGSIADDCERRGYQTVRYALEPQYKDNAPRIKDCDVVFIAVPTPTTSDGFDSSIVESALGLVGEGRIAVIKSTLLPGTTRRLQDRFPDRVVLFSPEFLCEATASYDVAHPMFNIIGLAHDSAGHRKAADAVQKLLPRSDHNFVIKAEAAELFKYAHNINGYMRVILANLLHDLGETYGVDWADVKAIMDADPMMSPYYNQPVHKGGRGAGGACFIKDMAAFRQLFAERCGGDTHGLAILQALEAKNLELLAASGKNQDLVRGVYGEAAASSEPSVQNKTPEKKVHADSDPREVLRELQAAYTKETASSNQAA